MPDAADAAAGRGPQSGGPDRAACGVSKGPLPLETLRQRADFLRAASARRQGTAGFLLQARFRDDARDGVRVGFTCSKKIGNAVARNRAKRRLRALARAVLAARARPGWDYVLVGRPEATIARDFASLRGDLEQALARIHDAAVPDGPPRGRRSGERPAGKTADGPA